MVSFSHTPAAVQRCDLRLHFLDPVGGVAGTLGRFVQDVHATQVVMGEIGRPRLTEFLRGDIIKTVLRQTRNVDVISRD